MEGMTKNIIQKTGGQNTQRNLTGKTTTSVTNIFKDTFIAEIYSRDKTVLQLDLYSFIL
jgi:hypothetical protein